MAATLVKSTSRSTNVPAARARTPRVRIDVDDEALADELVEALTQRSDLAAAAGMPADVVITDREPRSQVARSRTIVVGGVGLNAVGSRDSAIVLAAAVLVGAGYVVNEAEPALAHPGAGIRLSKREQEVAALLVEGASNKAIARALDISVHTAKFHVTAVLDKASARNRVDAVSIILREGLIAV